LTLLTSQLRPILNGVTDPAQSLRLEKPVELPATATDGELSVLVPPLLPAPVYDVSVVAELLAADKKTVLAVAYAPVRRMTVRHQVVVRLDGPARIEALVDPKTATTVKVTGQVERREGWSACGSDSDRAADRGQCCRRYGESRHDCVCSQRSAAARRVGRGDRADSSCPARLGGCQSAEHPGTQSGRGFGRSWCVPR